jgi:hypothetical protein
MTAHRAAAQAETDVTRARPDCLLAGTVPWQPRCHGRASRVPRPDASCTLVPRPESVKDARNFTRATLLGWGMTAVSVDAELVVSELITNALRHAMSGPGPSPGPGFGTGPGPGSGPGQSPGPGPRRGDGEPVIRLRLLAQEPHVMCMVTDPSREIPLRRRPSPEDATGRGLHVIESCSSRWGWHLLDEGGKVVWAVLPRANPASM